VLRIGALPLLKILLLFHAPDSKEKVGRKPGQMRRDSGGQHLLEEQSPGLKQMTLVLSLEKLYNGMRRGKR
jgi:hypothetical protein